MLEYVCFERNDMKMKKLSPAYKDFLWGGNKLVKEYGLDYEGDCLAEAWVLSTHKDGPSLVEENGQSLSFLEYLEKEGKAILGTSAQKYERFPLLIKLIDANRDLSIQVHPNDEYALVHEHQYGKTEAWIIHEAEEGASICYGFKDEITKEEFEKAIKENTLIEKLNYIEVHKGDVFLIEAGTIHATGKGIVFAEVQQSSTVTYRVYDYNRVDKDGNHRPLHIAEALEVTHLKPTQKKDFGNHTIDCDYFVVDCLEVEDEYVLEGSEESFTSLVVLEGKGIIQEGKECIDIQKGDSLFLPSGKMNYVLKGKMNCLMSRVK